MKFCKKEDNHGQTNWKQFLRGNNKERTSRVLNTIEYQEVIFKWKCYACFEVSQNLFSRIPVVPAIEKFIEIRGKKRKEQKESFEKQMEDVEMEVD